ncbi:MAG TPA: PPOX class F420-dependent oxidoreductase [Nitrososphaera sp.]|jgi:PPOX class probable F420-dependent enzyme|nr:PPOX class F420-dependent oxidoreductase [Nitrososphaera sp.]
MGKDTIQSEPVVNLFKGKNFAFVATVMKDGSPQITPTWVDIEGDYIIVNTAQGRLKQKNVSRDPRVAISLVDDANPYNMVTVRGKVVEQTTKGADEHIDKMAKKYIGLDRYPNHMPGEKRVILKIKPEKVYHQKPPR